MGLIGVPRFVDFEAAEHFVGFGESFCGEIDAYNGIVLFIIIQHIQLHDIWERLVLLSNLEKIGPILRRNFNRFQIGIADAPLIEVRIGAKHRQNILIKLTFAPDHGLLIYRILSFDQKSSKLIFICDSPPIIVIEPIEQSFHLSQLYDAVSVHALYGSFVGLQLLFPVYYPLNLEDFEVLRIGTDGIVIMIEHLMHGEFIFLNSLRGTHQLGWRFFLLFDYL